ncbi:MAG: DUF4177 domain-containing protein [Clostridia bacterium]|nr:DUF4177 domain-containing protein [Clostridia bacterium]
MEEFRKEVREMPTKDILLILEDQRDLYTEEEVAVLREELIRRADTPDAADAEMELTEAEMEMIEEEKRIAREKVMRENAARMANHQKKEKLRLLKESGYDGYYEYCTLTLFDNDGGAIPVEQITTILNDYALDGWRLVTAYANEVGRNSRSTGFAGTTSGTNATIDQNILILERYVKL